MNTRELRPVCSVGMFDFLKGIAILLIIIGHTTYCVHISDNILPFINIYTSLGNIAMYGFIIAAGFGIRKRPVKKCAIMLKEMFLLPYVITGLTASFLFSVNNYFLHSDFRYAIREGLRSLLGFAVGQHPIQLYGNYQMLNVGPAWFIVSLAGAWFVFNLILNYSQGWKRNLLVLLASLIGHFGNLLASPHGIAIPFCLFYMFVYVLGLYIGYLARAYSWFEKKISPFALVLIVVSLAGFVWKHKIPYEISSLGSYPLGIFTPFAAAAVGYGFTYMMTHVNCRENRITSLFEVIGNNTFYILFIHTVEYIGIPWSWFRESLPLASDKHIFFMILIMRISFIAIGVIVVKSFQNWGGFEHLKMELSRRGNL